VQGGIFVTFGGSWGAKLTGKTRWCNSRNICLTHSLLILVQVGRFSGERPLLPALVSRKEDVYAVLSQVG
jgi:hypothetical protein